MRVLKLLAGIALLPICVGATWVLYRLLWQVRPESLHQLEPSTWGLVLGFLLWLALYFLMPRPVRTYVLGHELTHALWALLMGGRVSDLKVSRRGGSVMVSKTNFLIALAPYFFPFYTFLVLLLFLGLSLFVATDTYEPFWMGLVGLTWSFHLTFTLAMLGQHQTDISEHGRLFSYSVIYALNLCGLCLWVVAVGPPRLDDLDRETRSAAAAGAEWASRLPAMATGFRSGQIP